MIKKEDEFAERSHNKFFQMGKDFIEVCPECKSKGKHLVGGMFLGEKIIQDVKGIGANTYGRIREHAKQITLNRIQCCENCGYNKHIEVCHKKHISTYPLTTKIKDNAGMETKTDSPNTIIFQTDQGTGSSFE